MKRLLLLSEWMTLGGAQSLLCRIAREAKDAGDEAVVHCRVLVDEQKHLLEECCIPVVMHKKWFNPKDFGLKDSDILITLLVYDYLKCKEYAVKQKAQCKVLLYVVHPLALIEFCRPVPLIRYLAKSDIYNGIRSGNIFFMDEQCVDAAFEHYSFDFSKEEAVIARLPIETQLVCDDETIVRRKQRFVLLTVARSEFPFKGYIRGLIQAFGSICKNTGQDLRLTIVTATSPGNDVDTLKCWIDESPFKDKITLALDVDNTSLRDYYFSSSLYIGMGTTILEAAERSVPTVPVEAYTYDCLADGLFFERPGDLVVREGKGRPIEPLIEHILAIGPEEYLSVSKECRNTVINMYAFSAFFDCIFKTGIVIKNLSFPSMFSWRLWSVLYILRALLKPRGSIDTLN